MFPGDQLHERGIRNEDLVDLYAKVSKGTEAKNALRIVGNMLEGLRGVINRSIAFSKPDPLEYAKAAGALWIIESLTKNLEISAQEGSEADETIRSVSIDKGVH